LDRQLKDAYGNPERIQVRTKFGKQIELFDAEQAMIVYLTAELVGLNCPPSYAVRTLLPNRKQMDQLPKLDQVKMIVKVTDVCLTSEDWVNVGPNYDPIPTKKAYQDWLLGRSWWQKHFQQVLTYSAWLKGVSLTTPPRQPAGDYWFHLAELPPVVLASCQAFAKQIQHDFMVLWGQVLGYPSPHWGQPQIKI
jgi:hypothetical protein